MNWSSWEAFWAMNGYAGFVWGSYGVVVAAFVLEVAALRRRRRAAQAELAREKARK